VAANPKRSLPRITPKVLNNQSEKPKYINIGFILVSIIISNKVKVRRLMYTIKETRWNKEGTEDVPIVEWKNCAQSFEQLWVWSLSLNPQDSRKIWGSTTCLRSLIELLTSWSYERIFFLNLLAFRARTCQVPVTDIWHCFAECFPAPIWSAQAMIVFLVNGS
jgi:hypothetical protein